jgi:hypothetical protein
VDFGHPGILSLTHLAKAVNNNRWLLNSLFVRMQTTSGRHLAALHP